MGGYWAVPISKAGKVVHQPVCKSETSLAAVNCCFSDDAPANAADLVGTVPTKPQPPPQLSCEQLGGQWQFSSDKHPATCSTALVPPFCHAAKSKAEAESICDAAGARLCKFAEIQAGVTKDLGCNLKCTPTWSSTACDNGKGSAGFWVLPSNITCNVNVQYEPKCKVATEQAAVQCCMDDDWIKNSEGTSVRKCSVFKWAIKRPAEFPGVCAAASVPQNCYFSEPFREAKTYCRSLGARLCSKLELESGVANTGGCPDVARHIWSADACGEKKRWTVHYSSGGKVTGKAKCLAESKSIAVQCCADSPVNAVLGSVEDQLSNKIQNLGPQRAKQNLFVDNGAVSSTKK
jgi:hypothetical protein